MAIIYSYPNLPLSSLSADDLLVITDIDNTNNNPTKSVKLSDIATYITGTGTGTGTTNTLTLWSDGPNGVLGDSILTQDAGATALTVTGNFISTGTGNFTNQVTIPATPSINTDAASKGYVDTQVAGIPAGLVFKGNWDASTTPGGSPDLTSAIYKVVGNYYVVSVAGSATPNGVGELPDSWDVGDWCVYIEQGGTDRWEKLDQTFIAGSGAAGQAAFFTAANSVSGDNDFFWDNTNKRLGIGTTAPDYSLDVPTLGTIRIGNGTSNSVQLIIDNNNTTDAGTETSEIRFRHYRSYVAGQNDAGSIIVGKEESWDAAGDRNSYMSFSTRTGTAGATEKMRITSVGNVGIGDLPSFKLDVNVTSNRARFKAATGDVNMELSSIAGHDWLLQSKSDDSFAIYDEDEASARLTIDNSGNVGIGISPSKKLTVFGTGPGEATVQIEGEGGADPYINFLVNNAQHWSMGVDDSDADKFKISEHSALGTNDYFTVDVTGNVGIGTTSPSEKLEVGGPIVWNGSLVASQTSSGVLDRSGDNIRIRAYGATTGSGVLQIRTGGGGNQVDTLALTIDELQNATFAGRVIIGDDAITTDKPGLVVGDITNNGQITIRGGQPTLFFDKSGSNDAVILTDSGSLKFKNGTLDSEGSDQLTLDTSGNATFAGDTQAPKFIAAQGTTYANGYQLTRTAHDTYRICLGDSEGLRIVNETDSNREELAFDGAGNATFAGNVLLGGSDDYIAFNTSGSGSDPKIKMNSDASFTFLNTAGSTSLTLENNGNATFTGDVVANGTIQTLVSNANLTISGDASGNVYYSNAAGEHRWRANGSSVNSMTLSSSLLTVNENATFAAKVNVAGSTNNESALNVKTASGSIGSIGFETGSEVTGIISSNTELMEFRVGDGVGIGDAKQLKIDPDGIEVTGDVEIANSSDGLILQSPDGTKYRVTVANGGTLSVSAV